jgi:hypothetical protein
MIPTAYKDGKLYSVRPTDGSGDFTFSRGSNLAATRVASSGYIEKGRENLLLQSNQFNTIWYSGGLTETSGQSGYDGTSNAWLIEAVSTGTRFLEQNVTSGVNTLSVYAKAGTINWIMLNDGGGSSAYFDLGNGVVGSNSGADYIDHSIESVGSGWYRCILTSVNISQARIYLAVGDGNLSNSVGNNIYIQDAQLEAGLVATDYIETGASTAQAGILEDMPRLDYSGGASCPALLLEPQRTNILAYSEGMFDSSYFLPINGISVEGQQTDLNGTNTAVKLSNFIAGASRLDYNTAVAAVDGKTYTYSAYYKGSGNININVSTSTGVGGAGEKTITLTNEWVRHSITATFSNPTGNVKSHLAITRTANNNAEVYLCFAQIEEGSYPTSYIPTYGSSVTRSQDIANLTDGVPNMIGANSFTFFYDCILTTPRNGSGTFAHLDLDGIIGIKGASNTTIRVHCIGSVNFATSVPILDLSSGRHKFAITMNSNGVGHYFVDGVKQTGEITYSGNGFVGDDSKIDGGAYNQKSNQLVVFPTALTDSECIALTTL